MHPHIVQIGIPLRRSLPIKSGALPVLRPHEAIKEILVLEIVIPADVLDGPQLPLQHVPQIHPLGPTGREAVVQQEIHRLPAHEAPAVGLEMVLPILDGDARCEDGGDVGLFFRGAVFEAVGVGVQKEAILLAATTTVLVVVARGGEMARVIGQLGQFSGRGGDEDGGRGERAAAGVAGSGPAGGLEELFEAGGLVAFGGGGGRMDAVEVDYHVVGGVAVGGEGFARQGGGFFGHGRGRACGCGCACGYAFVPGYSFFFGLTVGDFIPKKAR
mmetsp:Transcript_13462/g.28275  ORF Transcript_13462/g.28275 Transcript_13462/m.28275 type:complete len:272 (-) Transcript_13462:89-904(-)